MKRTIVCIIFLSIFLNINCSNLEEEIINYRIDNESFIRNARVMLAQELKNDNIEKVKDITALLISRYDYRLKEVFHAQELFVIGAETDSLALIFDYAFNISKTNTFYTHSRGYRNTPHNDSLSGICTNLLDDREDYYIREIKDSDYPKDEKDFILLCLRVRFTYDYYVDDSGQNEACDDFLEKYPESQYKEFIRDKIRFVYEPDKFGIGYSFHSGYGAGLYKYNNYFEASGIIQFALFVTYENFVGRILYKQDHFQSKKAFVENGTWEKNDNFIQNFYGIQIGNSLLEMNKFSIEPHISLGYTDLRFGKKDKRKDVLDLSMTTGIGISIKYRIDNKNNRGDNPYYDGAYFISIGCDYYNPLYNLKYDDYNGGKYSFSLGFGRYFKNDIRDL